MKTSVERVCGTPLSVIIMSPPTNAIQSLPLVTVFLVILEICMNRRQICRDICVSSPSLSVRWCDILTWFPYRVFDLPLLSLPPVFKTVLIALPNCSLATNSWQVYKSRTDGTMPTQFRPLLFSVHRINGSTPHVLNLICLSPVLWTRGCCSLPL